MCDSTTIAETNANVLGNNTMHNNSRNTEPQNDANANGQIIRRRRKSITNHNNSDNQTQNTENTKKTKHEPEQHHKQNDNRNTKKTKHDKTTTTMNTKNTNTNNNDISDACYMLPTVLYLTT